MPPPLPSGQISFWSSGESCENIWRQGCSQILQDNRSYESIIKGYYLLFPESSPKCFLSDLSTMGHKCAVHYVHISSELLSLSFKRRGQERMLSAPTHVSQLTLSHLKRDLRHSAFAVFSRLPPFWCLLPQDGRDCKYGGIPLKSESFTGVTSAWMEAKWGPWGIKC